MRFITIFFLLIAVGCVGHKHPKVEFMIAEPVDYMTIEALKLGLRLNTRDFAIDPVEVYFTPQELNWFETNKSEVDDIIIDYIYQDSTPAVMLAGYLALDSAMEALRFKLLILRRPYVMEGLDYTTENAWLDDIQYPYHTIYIDAIERITGKPIHAAIKLTPSEYNILQQYAKRAFVMDEDGKSPYKVMDQQAWCAKWLLIQLKLLEDEH